MRGRRLRDLPDRLRRRPHEPDFHVFERLATRPGCFVDIGANRGQTIDSVRACGGADHVHAIEPNPVLVAELQRRFGGDETITIHATGLGDRVGGFTLHVPRYGRVRFDTRASADRSQARDFLSAEHFARFDPSRAHVDEVAVRVVTLDQLGVTPDVVKIDVEGLATSVLRGGLETLRSHEPLVLVEEPDADAIDLLAELGYRPHLALPDGRLEEGIGELNTFFLLERHAELFIG